MRTKRMNGLLNQVDITPFEEAYLHFGRGCGLADLFGVSRASVSYWKTRGGFPPARAIQIEILSAGRFRAIDVVDQDDIVLPEVA